MSSALDWPGRIPAKRSFSSRSAPVRRSSSSPAALIFSPRTIWRSLIRARLSAAEPSEAPAPAPRAETAAWAFWTLSLTFTTSTSRRRVSMRRSVAATAVCNCSSAARMSAICGSFTAMSDSRSAMRWATWRARSMSPLATAARAEPSYLVTWSRKPATSFSRMRRRATSVAMSSRALPWAVSASRISWSRMRRALASTTADVASCAPARPRVNSLFQMDMRGLRGSCF